MTTLTEMFETTSKKILLKLIYKNMLISDFIQRKVTQDAIADFISKNINQKDRRNYH